MGVPKKPHSLLVLPGSSPGFHGDGLAAEFIGGGLTFVDENLTDEFVGEGLVAEFVCWGLIAECVGLFPIFAGLYVELSDVFLAVVSDVLLAVVSDVFVDLLSVLSDAFVDLFAELSDVDLSHLDAFEDGSSFSLGVGGCVTILELRGDIAFL